MIVPALDFLVSKYPYPMRFSKSNFGKTPKFPLFSKYCSCKPGHNLMILNAKDAASRPGVAEPGRLTSIGRHGKVGLTPSSIFLY